MFSGGGRFSGNQINVNTKCDSFYSDDARLDVGLWNGFVSLKIAPATGVDGRGLRQYETENNRIMSTSIKFENIETIVEGIEKEIDTNGKEKSRSISFLSQPSREAGFKKLTKIGYDADKDSYYLSITANIGEDGKGTEENTVRFNFEKKPYFVDYDITSGTNESVEVESDFNRFKKILNGYIRTVPMEHHGKSYAAAFKRPGNNGFNQQFNGNYGGFGAAPQQQGYQQPAQPAQQYSAPVTSFDGGLGDMDLPF